MNEKLISQLAAIDEFNGAASMMAIALAAKDPKTVERLLHPLRDQIQERYGEEVVDSIINPMIEVCRSLAVAVKDQKN